MILESHTAFSISPARVFELTTTDFYSLCHFRISRIETNSAFGYTPTKWGCLQHNLPQTTLNSSAKREQNLTQKERLT